MKSILITLVILGLSLTSCTNQNARNADSPIKDSLTTEKTKDMKNVVSIIEIPASDLKRAITFYKSILEVNIEQVDMGDVKMGVLPNAEGAVNVVLAQGPDYIPTKNGSVIYLNCGDNLQSVLDRIEPNGGTVLLSKTEISPEIGFFALFTDTEGNKLGLH